MNHKNHNKKGKAKEGEVEKNYTSTKNENRKTKRNIYQFQNCIFRKLSLD
jgi:hypothetical protein